MFRRPILSRIGKIQLSANFCSLENFKRSLVNSGAGISPSKSEPVSSKKVSPGKENVIFYLVDSCGLNLERAVSTSGKLHFDSPDKANAVMHFLEKHGFSKTQIAELVSRRPKFLLANPEKSFLPKIEFLLHSMGFSEFDMVESVVKHPAYLASSGSGIGRYKLTPVYEYVQGIVGSRKAGILLRRGSWIFDHGLDKKIIDNLALLRELGVPQSCIEFSLFHYPDVVTRKHESFKQIVSEIEGMGKRNWGWSKDDIYMAFRKHPSCMLLSEKKISRFLDFVANKMGRDSRTIARVPYIIFYSMEKRIIPRCSVLHHLFLNCFVKKNWSLTSVMCPTEEKFLENYVIRYLKELPQLRQIYRRETSDVV
ncbi:transcription termination factor MTERF15, mitochondrial-like [Henckelia pumila]|uniref:transcription termination factor MTERF15, mitochondrial-like n=1 Tax=Henckelia pumila TaxID=405737 RepID=UPI003C6DE377